MKQPTGEKRLPLLADRFLARRFEPLERIIHPKAEDQIRRSVRNARKFVFDEDAARRVARVVIEVPDLLVREHRFARAPYDVTWIEWPSWAYWQTLRDHNPKAYEAQGTWGELESADHTVGYLIDHGRINTLAGGTVAKPNGRIHITPIQYRLHTEWPVEDQLEFCRLVGSTRIGLDAAMWGSTYDILSQDERRMLRAYNVVEPTPFNPVHVAYNSLMKDGGLMPSMRGCVGDMRTVIAILLMLNRPSISRYVRTLPNASGWIKGKVAAYMAHTVINVNLDAAASLRLVGTSADDPNPRRRHEVRGHFCHDAIARQYMRIA